MRSTGRRARSSGHISDPTNPLVNGSARSGSARSGSARSGSARSAVPSDGDPLVQNTSFTLGSSVETTSGGGSALSSAELACPAPSGDHCRIDCCTLAAPRLPNEVTILVRAYQVKPTSPDPGRVRPGGSKSGDPTPPSVAVAEYSCDDPSCTAALGPDLAVQTSPAADARANPTRVKAGAQVVVPDHHAQQPGRGRGVRHRGAPALRRRPGAPVDGLRIHGTGLRQGAPLELQRVGACPGGTSRAR